VVAGTTSTRRDRDDLEADVGESTVIAAAAGEGNSPSANRARLAATRSVEVERRRGNHASNAAGPTYRERL